MKKLKMLGFGLLLTAITISLSGCYGSFGLTKKVYKWNGSLGNKFVNEAVFLGLNIIPVYSISLFIDGVFLNSVEFWTGQKLLALKTGENHIQCNNKDVKLIVKDDHTVIFNNDTVEAVLGFNKTNQSWYITRNGETHRLMSIDGNVLTAYNTAGEPVDTEIVSNN